MGRDLYCDNDVVQKVCCLELSLEMLGVVEKMKLSAWVLGTCKFVVGNYLSRKKALPNHSEIVANFDFFLANAQIIEPSVSEVALAAELETEAQRLNLALDGGESILLSAFLLRHCRVLLTGDKRAIAAIESLREKFEAIISAKQFIACIEQLFVSLLEAGDHARVSSMVCGMLDVDKALANSFSCRSGGGSVQDARTGLESYINSCRATAQNVMLSQNSLSGVVP